MRIETFRRIRLQQGGNDAEFMADSGVSLNERFLRLSQATAKRSKSFDLLVSITRLIYHCLVFPFVIII